MNLDWEKAVINEVSWRSCLRGTGCCFTISQCQRLLHGFPATQSSGSLQGGSHFCSPVSEWVDWRACSMASGFLVLLCKLWSPVWVGREQNGSMYEGSICFFPHCPLARRSASTGEGTCQALGLPTALQASGLSAPARSRQFRRGHRGLGILTAVLTFLKGKVTLKPPSTPGPTVPLQQSQLCLVFRPL